MSARMRLTAHDWATSLCYVPLLLLLLRLLRLLLLLVAMAATRAADPDGPDGGCKKLCGCRLGAG
jgi:hypothetical protein